MRPTKASTVDRRPPPVEAPAAPRLTDQLKEFAARAASQPASAGYMGLSMREPLTEPEEITEAEYDFFLSHPGNTDAYPTPLVAQQAEREYDRISAKMFAAHVQYKRNDGKVPEIEAHEFATLVEMVGAYEAANLGLRPVRPGETIAEYAKSVEFSPRKAPDAPPFRTEHDFRTHPIEWATDYCNYTDYMIQYLETELDRIMEVTGRSAQERKNFFDLTALASLRMSDAVHPLNRTIGSPDVETKILPLMDAASDILLTPVHRKFKLAPEQEVDLIAAELAAGNMDLAAQHVRDGNEVASIFAALYEIATEGQLSTSAPWPDEPTPARPKSPARSRSPARRGRVAVQQADSEARVEINSALIASPLLSDSRLRMDAFKYRFSLQKQADLERALSRFHHPSFRILLGSTIVPLYPIKWRLDRALALVERTSPEKVGRTPDDFRRIKGAIEEERSRRANPHYELLADAMQNVAWDVLITGVAGGLYSYSSYLLSDKLEAQLKEAESFAVQGIKALREVASRAVGRQSEQLRDTLAALLDVAASARQLDDLAAAFNQTNSQLFLEQRNRIVRQGCAFFSHKTESARQFFDIKKQRAVQAAQEKLSKVPKFSRILDPPTKSSEEVTVAKEEELARDLAESLTRSLLDTPNGRRSDARVFVDEHLASIVGKKEADSTINALQSLSEKIYLLEKAIGNPERTPQDRVELLRAAQRGIATIEAHGGVVKYTTEKCDSKSEICASMDEKQGTVSILKENARCVTEVSLAYRYLAAKTQDLANRIDSAGAPVPFANAGAILDGIERYLSVRGWDIEEGTRGYIETGRAVLERAVHAQELFDSAFETNPLTLRTRLFNSVNRLLQQPKGENETASVVLPYTNKAKITIGRAFAEAIAKGDIATNSDFVPPGLNRNLPDAERNLRRIRIGDVNLPMPDKPEDAYKLWASLISLKGTWEEKARLDNEANSFESMSKLERDVNEARAGIQVLVDHTFSAAQDVVAGSQEALARHAKAMADLSSKLTSSVLKTLDELNKAQSTAEGSFGEMVKTMVSVHANSADRYSDVSNAMIHGITSIIGHAVAAGTSAVSSMGRDIRLDDDKFYYNSTLPSVQRMVRFHFGDKLQSIEATSKMLKRSLDVGAETAKSMKRREEETKIKEGLRGSANFGQDVLYAALADETKTVQNKIAAEPKYGPDPTQPLPYDKLNPDQKARWLDWLTDEVAPAVQKFYESNNLRRLQDLTLEGKIEETRSRSIYERVYGETVHRNYGFMGVLESAAYAQNLLSQMMAFINLRGVVTSGVDSTLKQALYSLLSNGAIPIETVRFIRNALAGAFDKDGKWDKIMGVIAATLPNPNGGSKLFDAVNIKNMPQMSSDSSAMEQVIYLAATAAALGFRTGLDLFAYRVFPKKAVDAFESRTRKVAEGAQLMQASAAEAKAQVTDYYETKLAQMQASAADAVNGKGGMTEMINMVSSGRGPTKASGILAGIKMSASGWWSSAMLTNNPVSLYVSMKAAALQFGFLYALGETSQSPTAIALGALAGSIGPVCATFIERWIKRGTEKDPHTGAIKATTINAVEGGIGERWLLLKLLGRGEAAAKMRESILETQYDAASRCEIVRRVKYVPGDSPLLAWRTVEANVEILPRWNALSEPEKEAFKANTGEDSNAPALYEYLAKEMWWRDSFHSLLVAGNRVGSFWMRSGLVIVPNMMNYIASLCGHKVLEGDMLSFAANMPSQAGEAIAALTTALTAAFSNDGADYGGGRWFTRNMFVGIMASVTTMFAASAVEHVPAPIRAAFWFMIAALQGGTILSSVTDIVIKFMAQERAERATVDRVLDEIYDVLDAGHADTKKHEKVALLRELMRGSKSKLENHLLQMAVNGPKTSKDGFVQTAILTWKYVSEHILWDWLISSKKTDSPELQ